jgi:exonuclease I
MTITLMVPVTCMPGFNDQVQIKYQDENSRTQFFNYC